MGILDEVDGWVLIVLAVATASGRLHQLMRTRRSGARFGAVPYSVWSGLLLSVVWAGFGVNDLLNTHNELLGWVFFAGAVAALTSLAALGIMSRRSASVDWWRFWAQVTSTPS